MSVSIGRRSSAVVTESGEVWAWGDNGFGQLGVGDREDKAFPTRVASLEKPVRQVSVGLSFHTGMVTDDGDLFMCGDNDYGQLGLGAQDLFETPTQVPRDLFDGGAVLMVACGACFTVVATESGAVYTFGDGLSGALGLGPDETEVNVPTRVPPESFRGESVAMVAAGSDAAIALTADGHVFTWGCNSDGQLGQNIVAGSRDEPRIIPVESFGGEKVAFVTASQYCMAAITVSGQLYTWGRNANERLGHEFLDDQDFDEYIRKLSPTLVAGGAEAFGGSPALTVSCGWQHTLVRTREGGLWISGRDIPHQFWGNGFSMSSNVFEEVPASNFGSGNVVSAVAGDTHSAVVTDDGRLWTWGRVSNGVQPALGDGPNLDSAFTPGWVQIPGDKKIGRCRMGLPTDHSLAFVMAMQDRLGNNSQAKELSGETGLSKMIHDFCERIVSAPDAAQNSKALMSLMGMPVPHALAPSPHPI